MTGATRNLIKRLTAAFGAPVATPELDLDGRPHRYRVWRWTCPACGGGTDDWLYRPLVVDSDGRVFCDAAGCSAELIAEGARRTERAVA